MREHGTFAVVTALVALFVGIGVAQAGLYPTPLLNPSFESVENGGTPGGWGYVIDDWFENEQPDYWVNFYEKGADIGLAGDGALWIGTETGGKFYQDVGTVDDGQTLTVDALIGSRWGSSFVTGAFNLWAGPGEGAADAVELGTLPGMTQIASAQVTVASGTPVGTDVYSVSVDLPTGTGYAGQKLWLEIESVEGKNYFDAVSIVPEPGTLALLGIGGLLVFLRRKR